MRDLLTTSDINTLFALIRVVDRSGRATIRDVADEAQRSIAVTHKRIIRLEEAGMIVGAGQPGALRPAVWPVTFRQKSHAAS